MLVVQISLFSNLWILYEDFKNIPVFFTGFVIKSNLYSTVFLFEEMKYNITIFYLLNSNYSTMLILMFFLLIEKYKEHVQAL